MKRVLFVSDYTLNEAPGGAQISNSLIINKGRELGYEIIEHNWKSSIVDFLSHYDLIVSSNLHKIVLSKLQKTEYILKHPNHVRLEHDSCHYLSPESRKTLFSSTKKNFFLSNFHLDFFKDMYGDYFVNNEIVYDPIDTSIFKKSNQEKIYDIVYCGLIHQNKGFQNLLDYAENNKDRTINIFGWLDGNTNVSLFDKFENIKLNSNLSTKEVASVFQKAKAVFHSPIVNEPFCRMIAEAILCGVEEIIGSPEKIGSCLEFQKVGYEKFSDNCKNAADKFWNKIEL
tara:strand:- start:2520 stop:3374 length:855 start_codon:yes stop_codon:yes gene_type:complete